MDQTQQRLFLIGCLVLFCGRVGAARHLASRDLLLIEYPVGNAPLNRTYVIQPYKARVDNRVTMSRRVTAAFLCQRKRQAGTRGYH